MSAGDHSVQKPTNNLLIDGPDDNDGMSLRDRRRDRRLLTRLRTLVAIIILLLILLLLATGLAIYFGVQHHLLLKKQPGTEEILTELLTQTAKPRITKDVRLPYDIIPYEYYLKLQVHLHEKDPADFFFNGSVDINVVCHQKTDRIFIHAYSTLNVSLDQVSVTPIVNKEPTGPPIPISDIQYKELMQWYELRLAKSCQPGQNYRISFGQFRSLLRIDLKGWYLSSYTEQGKTKYLATSQLQPTDARRVFPCWDEPSFKAIFYITIIRHKEYKSLSNMHIEKTVALPNDWYADVFHPTVNTSTYLLAFVVSQFDSISSKDYKGRNFTVWARPEVIQTAKFALDIGMKIIRYFEEYFEVSYPLEKTDMIAVPDFSAGAMENWGLMIYREATMLWDKNTGTASGQQKVAKVISHEIAHQWFGNLVTLTWWDDLWLNEGFASFAETLGVTHVYPEWKMDEQFLLEDMHKVLVSDSLVTSRPVIQSVYLPSEINDIFDVISYNKGASILRMMQAFMGESPFRQGIKFYLTEYKFKNTRQDDLWRAMTNATIESGTPLDIKGIMETWLLQMNYPLVTIERIGERKFRINQTRYLDPVGSDGSGTESPFNFRWQIPLSYADEHTIKSNEAGLIWLKEDSTIFELDINPSSWYLFNIQQTGFYRIQYTEENWLYLIVQLMRNPEVIPVCSRSQIIDDLFNLVNRGSVPYTVFLDLTKYLSGEDSYVCWETASRAFNWLMRMLIMDQSYSDLLAYTRKLLDEPLKRIDWDMSVEDKDHMKNLYRATVAPLACRAQHPDCVERSMNLFTTWFKNSTVNNIPPSLRATVYCMGIQQGGQAEWEFLIQRMTGSNEDETVNILQGLACTRDAWNMKSYLSKVKVLYHLNGMSEAVMQMSRNPLGQYIIWEEIMSAWRRLTPTYNGMNETNKDEQRRLRSSMHTMLSVVSRPQHTMYKIPNPEEVEQVKKLLPRIIGSNKLMRAINEFIKQVEQNQKWNLSFRQTIVDWLKNEISRDKKS